MIPEVRKKYNSEFKQETYNNFIADINNSTLNALDFRICETPLFIDDKFSRKIQKAAYSILEQLRTEQFKDNSKTAVPDNLFVPNEDSHPKFLQIDFAVVRNIKGELVPQLIELQGFPSLYAFQA